MSSDKIKHESIEHHQQTHYLMREIPKSDIIDEFSDMETFEKATKQNITDEEYDGDLGDKYYEFLQNYDYEHTADLWTARKGGYDTEDQIVEEWTNPDNI